MTVSALSETEVTEVLRAAGTINSIGVSGTREMLSVEQQHAFFSTILQAIRAGASEVHHGACTGADAFTHYHMMNQQGVWTHTHPATGVDARYSAWDNLMRHSRRIDHDPKPTAERNQDIVDSCDVLIAAPLLPEKDPKSKRSGTWQTIRKAHTAGKLVLIADADGQVYTYDG